MKFPYRTVAVVGAALLAFSCLTGPALAKAPTSGQKTSVLYDSTVVPLHGNVPSQAFEAQSTSEFGDQINFTGTTRQLSNVVVTLSSWGCVAGHWYSNDCATPTGATFPEAITLNVYDPSDVTAPIASATQVFNVPFRPSASPHCTGDDLGKWYDSSLKTCFNGFATNVTFNFAGQTLPNSIVYGIAYNTTHYGYSPQGEEQACYSSSGGCGYDSLNVALSTSSSVGTDADPGRAYLNSSDGGAYCDRGTAGAGTFRLDSPDNACWDSYTPAVQFKANGGRN